MTISAPLAASLNAVAVAMREARDPWWIIASAAVALHGADPGPVGDVDVLLSVADAGRILPSVGVTVRAGGDHPDFRSGIFGRWTGAPLPIEFMADFSYRSGTDWHRVAPRTRQAIRVNGMTVFIPDRAELRRLLEGFGRPKDFDRARRLAALG